MDERKPSIGRIVHYYGGDPSVPYPAIITRVHSADCVNLTWFGEGISDDGQTHAAISVTSVRRRTMEHESFCWDWPPRV